MAVFLQPIYTQTVGSGGASTITFNNIPSTFTDLKLVASLRSSNSGATDNVYITINGMSSGATTGSWTRLFNDGGSRGNDRVSNTNNGGLFVVNATTATSNTFSSSEAYFANYANSNFKSIIIDSSQELNGTNAYSYIISGLIRDTNPITSITLQYLTAPLVQNSTISLYGILRSGV